MNIERASKGWLLAAALGVLASQPVLASKPIMPSTITGTVTAVTADGEVVVDGRIYHIQASSDAASEAPNIQVGQTVQVKLNGPPNSQQSQVVEIHATESR